MPSKEFGSLAHFSATIENDGELQRLARERRIAYQIESQAQQAVISLDIARTCSDPDSVRALRADAATRLVGIQTVLSGLLDSLRA